MRESVHGHGGARNVDDFHTELTINLNGSRVELTKLASVLRRNVVRFKVFIYAVIDELGLVVDQGESRSVESVARTQRGTRVTLLTW